MNKEYLNDYEVEMTEEQFQLATQIRMLAQEKANKYYIGILTTQEEFKERNESILVQALFRTLVEEMDLYPSFVYKVMKITDLIRESFLTRVYSHLKVVHIQEEPMNLPIYLPVPNVELLTVLMWEKEQIKLSDKANFYLREHLLQMQMCKPMHLILKVLDGTLFPYMRAKAQAIERTLTDLETEMEEKYGTLVSDIQKELEIKNRLYREQIYLMDCMDTNMTLLSYQVIQMLYLIEGLNRDQYLKMIELNRKEKSIISMEEMEMEIPYESPYILKDNPEKRRILIDRLKQLKENQELMQVMPPLNKTTYQWYSKTPLKPLEVLYPMIYEARY